MTLATLSAWHELVRTRNTESLSSILADEVVFYSPIVHTPQVGKTIALKYLSAAFHVFPIRAGTHWHPGRSAGVSG